MARHLLTVSVVLAAAVLARADSPAAALASKGFALLTHTDDLPPQANVYGATCETFEAFPAITTFTLPVDRAGKVSLAPEHVSGLPEGSLGWQIAMQFDADDPSQQKRTGYAFVAKDDLNVSHTLEPPGQPSETATLRLRPVWPVQRTRTFDLGALPPATHFHVGYALRSEWRIDGGCGAQFVVSIEVDGGAKQILREELQTFHDQAGATPPWSPIDIDLSAYAGRTVRLLLETRDAPGAPTPNLAIPLWGDPIVYAAAPPLGAAPPKVLMVSLDTLRADRLGCYGYARGTTPNLDALAAESYLFENALTPAPMTTPAHASAFSGVSPYRHRAGVFSEGFRLSSRWPLLAELLSARGYRTAAFTEGIAIAGSIGFARGFQSYSDGPSPEVHNRQLIQLTFGDAAAWLRQFGHLPSLLFAHTYHVHDPYSAPEVFMRRFTDPAYNGRIISHASDARTPEERQNASDNYDAGIAYADEIFGTFLLGLKSTRLLDDRWLIVFSDHGEEFWEHGSSGHARALYRESVHVPLLIRPPGGLAGGGQRIAEPVLITDLFATVLNLTGGTVPSDCDSQDLLAIAGHRAPAHKTLHGFYRGYEFAKDGQTENREWETFSIRAPAYTYITTAPQVGGPVTEEIFAPGDTAEKSNIAPERPKILDAARHDLERYRAVEAVGDSGPADRTGLEQQEIDALQGLGYF